MDSARLIRHLRRLAAEWSEIRDSYMRAFREPPYKAEYSRIAAVYELCSDLVRCAIGDIPLYLDREEVSDQMAILKREKDFDFGGIQRQLDLIDLENLQDRYPDLAEAIEGAIIYQGARAEDIAHYVKGRGKPAAWVAWLEGAARALEGATKA